VCIYLFIYYTVQTDVKLFSEESQVTFVQLSEWRDALTQLQTDVSARPQKQDIDAVSLLVDKQLKLLKAKLNRLSRQLLPAHVTAGLSGAEQTTTGRVDDADADAAVMKRQLVDDFSCLSCDKKLLFTRKQCVDIFRLQLLLVPSSPLASSSKSSLTSSSLTISLLSAFCSQAEL